MFQIALVVRRTCDRIRTVFRFLNRLPHHKIFRFIVESVNPAVKNGKYFPILSKSVFKIVQRKETFSIFKQKA